MSRLLLAVDVGRADGAAALAAGLGVACSPREPAVGDRPPTTSSPGHPCRLAETGERRAASAEVAVLVVEVGGPRRRPTMLASAAARTLEGRLRAAGELLATCSARGRICFLSLPADDRALSSLGFAVEAAGPLGVCVAHVPGDMLVGALAAERLAPSGALLRARIPADRALAALAVGELRARRVRSWIARRRLGVVASRRATAGLDPGGSTAAVLRRVSARLLAGGGTAAVAVPPGARDEMPLRAAPRPASRFAESGQVLPAVLAAALLVVAAAVALTALAAGGTGKGRVQRAADLVALSAARSMRDDLPRLFVPRQRADGSVDPRHLTTPAYLDRAEEAARGAATGNGVDPERIRVTFPGSTSFAPLRVRVRVRAELRIDEGIPSDAPARSSGAGEVPDRPTPIVAIAVAEATPIASGTLEGGAEAVRASGDYDGPLVLRQGKPMRPDVAAAFDRLADAAARARVPLTITSAYRSDVEQARLFARNPDPRWVAPPGRSLHRCGTELDLGPPAAHSWLARAAPRFGFVRRYAWEPWHFGYDAGPPPCSASRDLPTDVRNARRGDGADSGRAGLPAFVPARFRAPIRKAAGRWNVSAGLLSAQLLAESNFNPYAVSSAGARGIAQFVPATARAYGLSDPFDAPRAIDAQARLMADLLSRFGSVSLALAAYNAGPGAVGACGCVPPYAETRAYVAKVLGLLGGSGETGLPALEVRLVS